MARLRILSPRSVPIRSASTTDFRADAKARSSVVYLAPHRLAGAMRDPGCAFAEELQRDPDDVAHELFMDELAGGLAMVAMAVLAGAAILWVL